MSGSPSQSSGAPAEATPSSTGADPSMEDILASIRRILSEEDGPVDQVEAPKTPEPPVPEPERQPDVLLLDSSMLVEDAPPTVVAKPALQEPLKPTMTPPEISAPEEIVPTISAETKQLAQDAGLPDEAESTAVAPFMGEAGPTVQADAMPALTPPPVLTMEPAAIVPAGSDIEPARTIGATRSPPTENSAATTEPSGQAPDAALMARSTQANPGFVAPPAMTSSQSETSPMSASTSSSAASSSGAFSSDDLASPEAATAAAGSVSNLVRALTSDRGAQVHSGGPTITDLVREELRPMLKSWLDSNLPPLVERLVRAEIDRVISRASV